MLEKKLRSASKEDTDLLLCFKNSDLHLRKIHICFYVKKNSDLYLRKIQIFFMFLKIQICI